MDWLPIALAVSTAILGVISTIAIYGFATGKYIQRSDDHREDVEERLEVFAKHLSDLHREKHELDRALRDEDHARRAIVDRINTDLGRLELRLAVIERQNIMNAEFDQREVAARDRRFEKIEATLEECLRVIHQKGPHNR